MVVVYLDKDYVKRKTGMDVEEIIDLLNKIGFPTEEEEKLVVEITPNRPDMFGWEGIIRTVLNYTGKNFKKYEIEG